MARTEDIVGESFFALLICGLALLGWSSRQANGSRWQHVWRRAGLMLAGFAFLWLGLATRHFVQNSANPQIAGQIVQIGRHGGGDSGLTFMVQDDSGARYSIRCRYEGPGLRLGDRAQIRYSAYDLSLIDLTMESGSFTGWHLHEDRSAASFAFMMLMGAGLLLAGLLACRQSGPVN